MLAGPQTSRFVHATAFQVTINNFLRNTFCRHRLLAALRFQVTPRIRGTVLLPGDVFAAEHQPQHPIDGREPRQNAPGDEIQDTRDFAPTVGADHPEPVPKACVSRPDRLFMEPLALRTLVIPDVGRVVSTRLAEIGDLGNALTEQQFIDRESRIQDPIHNQRSGKARVATLDD